MGKPAKQRILDRVSSPADLADLDYEQLEQLAYELRVQMVAATSVHGGHLAPSLGAVELIIALHRVLNSKGDRICFDVGHQAYAHKLLTGRKEQFKMLRCLGGISGFPKIDESPYDAHDSGHASDSLSTALGYALARDLNGGDETIAVLIGDASFTGGMAMEALNSIGHSKTRMIIVLNDNGMSISPNVGGFAAYLAKVRMSHKYLNVRDSVEEAFNKGKVGRLLMKSGNVVKESVKQFVLPGDTFLEGFGLTYIGPVNGHDIPTLEAILQDAKQMKTPVVIHAVTTKGKGYAPAEEHPDLFHGVSSFDIATGEIIKKPGNPSWTSVFGDELEKMAAQDEDIVAITAAMCSGTGLSGFAKKYPKRFFDTGIAEEHAVTMASALALGKKKPFVAIYSTFFQRAYDQIMINVGLQRQHVVFCVDRAGLVGADGPTHHGAFDLSYFRTVPNMTVIAPSNDCELRAALRFAAELDGPVALRYPRGSAPLSSGEAPAYESGHGVALREGSDAALLAVGRMVAVASQAAEVLEEQDLHVAVYDMRFVKPVDTELAEQAAKTGLVVTLEDNSIVGGFGSAVAEALVEKGTGAKVVRLGLPDDFVTQGTVAELDKLVGIDAESVANRVVSELGR